MNLPWPSDDDRDGDADGEAEHESRDGRLDDTQTVAEAADPGPGRDIPDERFVWVDADPEVRWDRYLVTLDGSDDAWISVDTDRIDVVDLGDWE